MYAIKEAVIAKEHAKDDLDAAIFFMDMRTYGKDFERYYNRAEEETGVRFIRCRVHSIVPAAPGSDDLSIEYVDEAGKMHAEIFDLVVLSIGLEISKESKALAERIGIEVDAKRVCSYEQLFPDCHFPARCFYLRGLLRSKRYPLLGNGGIGGIVGIGRSALRIAKFSYTGKDLSA